MNLPKAKTDNVIVQNLNDETLIYDLTTNQAFCLNETSTKVFESCNGKATFAELKAKHQFTDEVIYLALDELKKENLIGDEYISPFAGMSRREVIRKVGLASIIALPVIFSIVAPTPAQAASAAAVSCVNPGGLPAGSPTTSSCAGAQSTCRGVCNNTSFIRSQCCNNTATAAPGCSPSTACACICT